MLERSTFKCKPHTHSKPQWKQLISYRLFFLNSFFFKKRYSHTHSSIIESKLNPLSLWIKAWFLLEGRSAGLERERERDRLSHGATADLIWRVQSCLKTRDFITGFPVVLAEFVKWGDEENQLPRDFRWENPSTTHYLEILKGQYHSVPLLGQCVWMRFFQRLHLEDSSV